LRREGQFPQTTTIFEGLGFREVCDGATPVLTRTSCLRSSALIWRPNGGVLHLEQLHQSVGEARVEISLRRNRAREQKHMQKTRCNIGGLEGENQKTVCI